jgi:hypothetical protein
MQVKTEKADFHVNTVQITDTRIKKGNQSTLLPQRRFLFINIISLQAPIAATAAPEYAPRNK